MMIGYLSSFGSLTDFLHLMDILLNGELVEWSDPVKFVHCEVCTKVHTKFKRTTKMLAGFT